MNFEYRSFVMELKPGYKSEYIKRHQNLWPELANALRSVGIVEYRIYFDENTNRLYAHQRLTTNHKMADLQNLPIMKKWWDMMSDIMEHNTDKSPKVFLLEPVFVFES